MSAAALSSPALTPSRPAGPFWRFWFRFQPVSLRELVTRQAAVLREAALAPHPGILAQHRAQAAANHRQSLRQLQAALITPFDSEDMAALLAGIARTVNCLGHVAAHPESALDAATRDWVLALAGLIPTLPAAGPVDAALPSLAAADRQFRFALRASFRDLPADPLEAVRRQAVRERYHALHASLRALTFHARRVRYRNG